MKCIKQTISFINKKNIYVYIIFGDLLNHKNTHMLTINYKLKDLLNIKK